MKNYFEEKLSNTYILYTFVFIFFLISHISWKYIITLITTLTNFGNFELLKFLESEIKKTFYGKFIDVC